MNVMEYQNYLTKDSFSLSYHNLAQHHPNFASWGCFGNLRTSSWWWPQRFWRLMHPRRFKACILILKKYGANCMCFVKRYNFLHLILQIKACFIEPNYQYIQRLFPNSLKSKLSVKEQIHNAWQYAAWSVRTSLQCWGPGRVQPQWAPVSVLSVISCLARWW